MDSANKWAERGFRLVHFVRGSAGNADQGAYWQGIIEKVVEAEDESGNPHSG